MQHLIRKFQQQKNDIYFNSTKWTVKRKQTNGTSEREEAHFYCNHKFEHTKTTLVQRKAI